MDLEVQLLNETNIYDFQKALYMLIIQELVSSNIDQKPLGPETKVFYVEQKTLIRNVPNAREIS
jgi:hypothetical protein